MSFHFSFGSHHDVDLDCEHDNNDDNQQHAIHLDEQDNADKGPAPTEWQLGDLLATLPPALSYSPITITLDQPQPAASSQPTRLHLPRRDLFDARFQLLHHDHSDDATASTEPTLQAQLNALAIDTQAQRRAVGTHSDLEPGVYEGGLKTWECAADLIAELDSRRRGAAGKPTLTLRGHRILELGCGTALPSMYILAQLLSTDYNDQAQPSQPRTELHLADFNIEVLRLVTLPNLILTWFFFSPSAEPFRTASTQDEQAGTLPTPDQAGELDLALTAPFPTPRQEEDAARGRQEAEGTQDLLQAFVADLQARNLHLRFFSGPWARLDEVLFSPSPPSPPPPPPPPARQAGQHAGDASTNMKTSTDATTTGRTREGRYDLILSSETVYALSTLPDLVSLLYTCSSTTTPATTSLQSDEDVPKNSGPASTQQEDEEDASHASGEEQDQANGSSPKPSPQPSPSRNPSPTLILIAAKILYFGVGGGVQAFTHAVERGGGRGGARRASSIPVGGQAGQGGQGATSTTETGTGTGTETMTGRSRKEGPSRTRTRSWTPGAVDVVREVRAGVGRAVLEVSWP